MLNGVSAVLLYFLVNFAKVEPVIAGAMLFGSEMLDVFTDPLMSIISDRTKSPMGRRRPYILGGQAVRQRCCRLPLGRRNMLSC